MKLSAKQAATKVGKSTPTITRAIKNGRLSAQKDESGKYEIDPSELFRVFPAINSNTNLNTPLTKSNNVTRRNPHESHDISREVGIFKQMLADKDSTIDDLRRRLDQESEERRKLNTMLIDQRTSFWRKVWGK